MQQENRTLISYQSFEDFWAAVLMEKEHYPDDVAYQSLTKNIAFMIWQHALSSLAPS